MNLLKKNEGFDKTHKLCEQCPGYCCFRFSLCVPITKTGKIDYKKMLKTFGPEKNPDKYYAVIFMKNNFQRLKISKYLIKHVIHYSDTIKRVLFTCKRFDIKIGKCIVYNKRPIMCQTYFCPPLQEEPARIPKADEMIGGELLEKYKERRFK